MWPLMLGLTFHRLAPAADGRPVNRLARSRRPSRHAVSAAWYVPSVHRLLRGHSSPVTPAGGRDSPGAPIFYDLTNYFYPAKRERRRN